MSWTRTWIGLASCNRSHGLNFWRWEGVQGGAALAYNDMIVPLDFTSAAGRGCWADAMKIAALLSWSRDGEAPFPMRKSGGE